MAGYYPGGVTQADIDRAAGGYDPPRCECVYHEATDSMDSEDCLLHGTRDTHAPAGNCAEPLLGNSLSPTQVRAFLDCSARWWFKYGLHLPEPKTGNLALGIAVHQALEGNFREKVETKATTSRAGFQTETTRLRPLNPQIRVDLRARAALPQQASGAARTLHPKIH